MTLSSRFLSALLAWWLVVGAAPSARAERVTIQRDDFGIPHIFAETEEGACYGMGYAQAEDRLDELLRQYRRATGTMSEAFGPAYFRDDYRQRLWQHAAIARARYQELDAKTRSILSAYKAGVGAYMKEHPAEVPAWAPQIEPWMCVALARYIIWGWPEGDAGGDMQRGGITPDPIEYHGSNEWLVAPRRTAAGAVIALIDPHLNWYGQFRFYEARLYGGALQLSGMAIVGLPFPTLGHSRYASIAMTTGGPDAADCYEEELNPDNTNEYRYDGAWRAMTIRSEVIRVREADGVRAQTVPIAYTHHGPVVARRNGKAYVLKIPYFDQVRLIEQAYRMVTARNLDEMKQALGMLQLMEQNVMVGTVDGDIFYLRNGRVPIRPSGLDTKRPIPGNTSQTEWLGIHAVSDLVQLENPPQGYMQNCNVSPQFITDQCPLVLSRWAEHPYLFNGFLNAREHYDNPLHQRAAMCLELLRETRAMTAEDAIRIAMSNQVYGADAWQEQLRTAWARAGEALRRKPGPASIVDQVCAWDRHCDPGSTGAIAYRYWKDQLGDEVKQSDRAGLPPPRLGERQLLDAVERAAEQIQRDFGRSAVPYGEVYRVGREGSGRTWPVGGGSVSGMATPRAISFEPVDGGRRFLGHGGQTSTQVVLLTRPPQSWTVLPLGESDHSPHFDDQAEKLFSRGRMKPTYFMDHEALMKHVEATRELEFAQE